MKHGTGHAALQGLPAQAQQSPLSRRAGRRLPPAPAASRGQVGWMPIVLLAACALLRVATLLGSGAGLHVDEAQYWDWSRELHWGYYSKPPVIALLIRASTALAGDSLLGLRWLAMLCWLGSGAALWRLGTAMGSARAGLWAAALLAGTPAAGLLGLVATTDAPLMLCWALAMMATWHALQASLHRPPPEAPPAAGRAFPLGLSRADGWWCLAGLALGIGLLSKYTMAAFVLSWLLLAWRARSAAVRRGVFIALACGAGVFAPHLLWNAAAGWPTLRHTAEITVAATAVPAATAWRSLAEYFVGQMLMAGPVLVLVGAAAFRSHRALATRQPAGPGAAVARPCAGEAPSSQVLVFAMTCALPLLAIGAAQSLRHPVQINWVAPALLGLCLAAGWQARGGSVGWLLAGLLLSSALITAVALGGDLSRLRPAGLSPDAPGQAMPDSRPRWDIWSRMRGWDAALDALRPALARWPDAAVVATRRDLSAHAAYAWRDLDRRLLAWPSPARPRNHYEWRQAWSPAARPADPVLVLTDSGLPPPSPSGYADAELLQQVRRGRVVLQLWMVRPQPEAGAAPIRTPSVP